MHCTCTHAYELHLHTCLHICIALAWTFAYAHIALAYASAPALEGQPAQGGERPQVRHVHKFRNFMRIQSCVLQLCYSVVQAQAWAGL